LVPFLVVTGFIISVAVLVATGAVSTRTWADISIIWLVAPMLIFALLLAILLGFLVYWIARILQVTPRYTGKAQSFFTQFSTWTRKLADGAATPFIWFQQVGAILKFIFKL